MTKSLLISIQPQHLLNILNGDKTYEVRKAVPKWVLDKLQRGETVEAYLYCTKGNPLLGYEIVDYDDSWGYPATDGGYSIQNHIDDFDQLCGDIINGTIPVKVVIDGYDTYYLERPLNLEVAYRGIKNEHGCEYSKDIKADLIKHSGLTFTQLFDYGTKRFDGQQSVIKALHISKVEILDEVMKLGDFVSDKLIVTVCGDEPKCYSDTAQYYARKDQTLKRPPVSMMSVWVK